MIEQELKRFGLTVKKYRWRRDIAGVSYRGLQAFNIPTRLMRWSNLNNKVTGMNMIHPNYHEVIFRARLTWWKAKSTQWWKEICEESVKQQFDPNYEE